MSSEADPPNNDNEDTSPENSENNQAKISRKEIETEIVTRQIYDALGKLIKSGQTENTQDISNEERGGVLSLLMKDQSKSELKKSLRIGLKKLNQLFFEEFQEEMPKGEAKVEDKDGVKRVSHNSGSSGSSGSTFDFTSGRIEEEEGESTVVLSPKPAEVSRKIKRKQTLSKSETNMVSVPIGEVIQKKKSILSTTMLDVTDMKEEIRREDKKKSRVLKRKDKVALEEEVFKETRLLMTASMRTEQDDNESVMPDEENEFLASSKDLASVKKSKVSLANRLIKTKFDHNYLRRLVSQNRKRYVDKAKGYDLDLVYVTPKLIAMGHPSRGIEVLYRNSYGQVMKFFEESHKDHYRIYNLCMKRKYPLKTNVEHYGFCDHNACPMTKLYVLLDDIERWIGANDLNVAVVHCKAGKGRTGLVSSCFLLKHGKVNSAEEAIEYFGRQRTRDGRGLTVSSQRRYVYYYEKARLSELGQLDSEINIQRTVQERIEHISLHSRVRLPAHSSPKFYLSKVVINKIPNWLRSWRSGLVLKFSAGVPAGVLPLASTNPGDFVYPSQLEERMTGERGKAKNRRQTLSLIGKNIRHEDTWIWSSTGQKNVSNAWFMSTRVNGQEEKVKTSVPEVQGDFRITAFNESNMNLKRKKKRKLFQLWLNTNFFKVQYGDCVLDSYELDSKWMKATPEDGFSAYKEDLESQHKFNKFGLDGKLSKDVKHKYLSEDFEVIFHFKLAPEQPLIRT